MKFANRKEKGTIQALLIHSSNVHLPRLLQTHQKVTHGYLLNDTDMKFMQDVCTVTGAMRFIMNDYPDYHDFIARYISLIREITGLALSNEIAK
jgi:hypothetical protein